jgi:hypothetical protein
MVHWVINLTSSWASVSVAATEFEEELVHMSS